MAFAKKKSKSNTSLGVDQFLQKIKSAVADEQGKKSRAVAEVLSNVGITTPLVLLSEQHVRVKRLISWLRENLFEDSNSGYAAYFGGDLSNIQHAEHINSALLSLSLFSKNELIVVYEAEKIKLPAQKSMVEALPRRTNSALLVLCAASINQKSPLLLEAAALGTVVELVELTGAALDKWLEKEVLRVGIASGIQPEAKQLLTESYGGDVSRLASEIEKLSLLSVPGEKINRKLVEAISLKNPEVTSFELVRQVAAKNPLYAVSLVNDLVAQGLHPLQVNAFLSRAFRVLLANKDTGGVALHPDLSNPWFLKQLSSSLRNFSVSELTDVIERLGRLDFQLKDSSIPPPLALSLAVQEIAAR